MRVCDPASHRDEALQVLRTLLSRGPVPYGPHPGEWDWWTFHADPRDQLETLIGPDAVAEIATNHGEVAAFGLSPEDVIELGRTRLPGVRFSVTHVSMADQARVNALLAAGFELEHPPAPLFERATAGVTPIKVDGFEIRPIRGEEEHEARADAARLAFASTLDPEAHRARYLRFMRSPGYAPERDIVVVAPDGTIASFAIYWQDDALSLGQFEPVGTHPAFQRRGLARAVLHEGLARLAAAGIRRARVMTGGANEAAKATYLAAGFRLVDEIAAYRAPAAFGSTPIDPPFTPHPDGVAEIGINHGSTLTNTSSGVRRFPTTEQLAWVERAVGSGAKVTGGRRMLGGITSSVHRLSLRLAGGATTQVVLKRYTDPDWGDTRAMVANEAAALTAVEAMSVPAPRLLGASPDGSETDGIPSLLMTRAPGRVSLTPADHDAWIRQLATLLPRFHESAEGISTRELRDLDAIAVPASARRPDVWMAAKRVLETDRPPGKAVFVHGDYQHFNILWSRGRLSALVDWSSSRLAPPDVDVGHCRLNLAVLYSAEIAERFRHAYEAEAGRRVEPWWDIHQLTAYNETWRDFIPVQVAGRAPVDVRGMTDRVEELLALALARL